MEDKKQGSSFCAFIGKIVLRIVAIIAIAAAAKAVLSKVFHKTVEISVNVKDEELPESEDDGEDEEPEEESDGDETEEEETSEEE